MGNARILLELLGIFKYNLTVLGHTVIEVPQTTLKKFATDSGKAMKRDMVLRAFKEYGIDDVGEDGVDAFWLAKFAETLKTKDYNLNTSLKSYIDPRIYFDWAEKVDYDWTSFYSKTLQKKFSWLESK